MLDTAPDNAAVLSRDWSLWLAKNRMLGMSDDALVEIVVRGGVPEGLVRAELARLSADPCFEAGRWVADRLHKLESILEIQEALHDLAPSSRRIERRRTVSQPEFLTGYYAENRPLVLLDYADTWAARNWTVSSLREVLGDEPVEVMTGRSQDARYEINSESHRSSLPFREYADRVRSAGHSNDIYLVANNHLLDVPAAAPLWTDFDADQPPLNGSTAPGNVFLWFGPAGTITPLHHDVMNVLFVQLHGRKRFTLVAPAFAPRVYNEVGVYAEVDPEAPDYRAHPAFRGVPTSTVVLEPGETLFLPIGWWHRVESLDVSISLSFTNFVHPNEFRWQNPDG
jgi:hypothetical protein